MASSKEESTIETIVIEIPKENGHWNLKEDYFKFPLELIHRGDVVAFPTETVYGLGANALNPEAVKKIFLTKKRPQDNPLIVHISSLDMLPLVAKNITEKARLLIDKFWPGPLTILFEKSDQVPDCVVCNQPTVAVRMPSHPIAVKLISMANVPIAAPSANLSGRPSPTSARHVLEDLKGRCYCIIDGGSTPGGVESTVLDLNRELILRPGGVTLEQLRIFIPSLAVYGKDYSNIDLISKPPTPGLKYRHYSPSAQVILLEGNDPMKMQNEILRLWKDYTSKGQKIGLIHTHQSSISLPEVILKDKNLVLVVLGDDRNYKEIAKGLFATLRDMDGLGVDVIIMEGISEEEEGLAVMNRIRKAAKDIILCHK